MRGAKLHDGINRLGGAVRGETQSQQHPASRDGSSLEERILDRRPICQILIGRRANDRGDNDSTRSRRENEPSSIHFSSLIECTRMMQMTAAWRS